MALGIVYHDDDHYMICLAVTSGTCECVMVAENMAEPKPIEHCLRKQMQLNQQLEVLGFWRGLANYLE
jgi:hypothetical protein